MKLLLKTHIYKFVRSTWWI